MSHLYRRNKIYWLAFYKNGKLYRQSLKTKDRSTANYLKSKIEQEVAEGKYILYDPNISCNKVFEEYQKSCQFHKTPDTHKDEGLRIKRFLEWANVTKMNQITEKKLQDYLNHRIKNDGISLNTANHIITNIKTWLNFAIRRRYISENPLKHLKKYKLPENPPRFLTKEEINRILLAAKDTMLYPLIATALYTGMRQKELFTLEWQDIDFNRNLITIYNKDDFTTKSKKFRTIPLHQKLKVILEPYRAQNGRCFDTTNQRRIFNRIIKKAGLKGIGWHSLRHSCASHLAMQGVDLPTIAQILGHSQISTTMVYTHLTKDHAKAAIERLNF